MPFPVPSADDLTQQITADIQARVPGADTTLPRSTLSIMAKVWARALALVWGFLGRYWPAQFFIDSAETTYLERRCAPFGIVRIAAVPAMGSVTFSGTNTVPIPAGTVVQTADGSVQYQTAAPVTIASGTATAAVTAMAGGAASNQAAGVTLALYTGIGGVQPVAVVASGGLTGGADAESDASLRARGIARQSQSPQGGAWFDYVAWAKAVAGVTRVWVYPLNRGPGTVDVIFVMDGRSNIVPLSADVAAVQAAINAVLPVTADCLVVAPTTAALPITITSMLPGDAGTQANVTAQLTALVRTIAPGGALYGDGVSAANPGGHLYLSQIVAAIEAAGGIAHFDLTVPSADVTYGTGVIPAAPTITFA